MVIRNIWLIVLQLLIWTTGALAGSPVPAEYYVEVDHGLRPAVVLADPEAYRGRTLLLGGSVVRTVSEPGYVTMTVDGLPLDADDRPVVGGAAAGQYIIRGQGADGARLQPGRLVTLIGTVDGWNGTGAERRPELELIFVHSWPTPAEEAESRRPAYGPGSWCDPWWYDPWCDPWYWGPYPRWRMGFGYYRGWH